MAANNSAGEPETAHELGSEAAPRRFDSEYCDSLDRFDRGVSLLCWAYNEEDLVEEYLVRISALLRECIDDFEIVFVDDCSTDRTNEIVRNLAAGQIPEIRLIRNERNLNVGLSSRRAISEASKEYLFWQTIDWSYDIEMLRAYLELLRENDVVAGVRRAPVAPRGLLARPVQIVLKLLGSKHLTRRSDTVGKALVSIINYSLIRFLFRVPLSDYQNVCFYPTKLVQAFNYEARTSFANPEGLIRAYWQGASIVEVPISFLPRQAGEAKGATLNTITRSTLDVFCMWFRWNVLRTLPRLRRGQITRLDPTDWPDRTGA